MKQSSQCEKAHEQVPQVRQEPRVAHVETGPSEGAGHGDIGQVTGLLDKVGKRAGMRGSAARQQMKVEKGSTTPKTRVLEVSLFLFPFMFKGAHHNATL